MPHSHVSLENHVLLEEFQQFLKPEIMHFIGVFIGVIMVTLLMPGLEAV